MKKTIIGIAALIALIAGIQVQAQQTPKNGSESIMGTWMIITSKIDGKLTDDSGDASSGNRRFLMLTDSHFVYGQIDPSTMKIKKFLFGGSYTLKDNQYTENLEPGGKKASHTIRLDGDKLYKSGSLTTGVPCEQVWERFKSAAPKSSRSAADGSVSVGQQLIDLSKAKEAGVITDAEFQVQKAKLLGNK